MLDPRLIAIAPLLCVLACTASYPNELGEPDELVIADDLDDAPLSRPPRTPGHDSTSLAEFGGYSGIRGFEGFGGRGTRVPTVRQARPEVVGALDKDLIRRTVRAHLSDVRRCYNEVLARDPNAKGRVAIAFEIDGKGKVSAATVHESTMKDDTAATCIAAAVAGWKFPRPRTGTVKVVHPFVLEPG